MTVAPQGQPEVTDHASNPEVRELLDKQAIREVVYRYCRGIDRLDSDLVRSCFHPDATDEHGAFMGNVDDFIAWVWPLLQKYDMTMHLVGNHLVELSGSRAHSEAYGIAFHRTDDGEPHRNLVIGFRYIDRFEQRDGGWRIAGRIATSEWARVDPHEQVWPIPEDMRQGRRDRQDAVYDPVA